MILTEAVGALSGLLVLGFGLMNALGLSVRLYPDGDTAAKKPPTPNGVLTATQGIIALLRALDAAVKAPRRKAP